MDFTTFFSYYPFFILYQKCHHMFDMSVPNYLFHLLRPILFYINYFINLLTFRDFVLNMLLANHFSYLFINHFNSRNYKNSYQKFTIHLLIINQNENKHSFLYPPVQMAGPLKIFLFSS